MPQNLKNNCELLQVALRREARVAQEAKEKEIQIAEELRVHGEIEKRRLELADQLVRDEIEDLKNVITDEARYFLCILSMALVLSTYTFTQFTGVTRE